MINKMVKMNNIIVYSGKFSRTTILSPSAIANTKGEVTKVIESEKEKTMNNCKRGEYTKYSPAVKNELVKCAALHGIIATHRKPYTRSRCH